MAGKKSKHDLREKQGKRSLKEFSEELKVDAGTLSRALNHGQIGWSIKARCLEVYGWPLDGWE